MQWLAAEGKGCPLEGCHRASGGARWLSKGNLDFAT